MKRKQFIYLTNLSMVPLFILSLYTGIKLHITSHSFDTEALHRWSAFHCIASLLFVLLVSAHIRSHWGWYKNAWNKRRQARRHIVFLLSFIFISTSITGILLLLGAENAVFSVSMLHYRIGLLLGILVILHILKRLRFFL